MENDSDIENQNIRKEKCLEVVEKNGSCILGCWLLLMLIMSILISEHS